MFVNFRSSFLWKGLLAALLLSPLVATAGTIEGKMNGISCAVAGVFCPIDQADPLVALESDFVVQTADGSFYIIPNVDRAVKARVVLENVRITGEVNDTYKTINADTLEVKRDGEMKTVWTQEMQDQLQKQLLRGSQ